ncbi:hypothetical protein BX659_10527 [Orenia metallireducens]|jgi:uncharacterized protein involved in response to NO|uniref:Uncharacterized protein n=1 Tax=Orenia metallireducens TaxID=1413210 RepID=A0A285G352_9FIRM|nr:hypothetical protein [Orenia metallireducens]PRX31704.1 hypothetical protein BX659_10527 [Orenia metallireducens]SNY16966.1 hypothetical protein SAMN06265827_10427 [Orenia metallireducens]
MKIITLTLFFIVLIYFQVKGLVKQKEWKELFVYTLLMSIGILYSYGVLLELSLPNPILILSNLFKPLYEYIFNQLLA